MINATLTFNGDRQAVLSSKDADDKTLMEIMFKNNGAWRAELVDGSVVLRPIVVKDEKPV